jgi:hypothetical protein
MVKLHKQCIVPVAIEISAGNLFIEKVPYIMRDKHIFLGHPLRWRFGHRAIIMEWHILPRVVTFPNPINSFVHLCSRFSEDIIVAIFGGLCCPQPQSFIDGRLGRLLPREVIICKFEGKSILEEMKWIARSCVERPMTRWRSIWV